MGKWDLATTILTNAASTVSNVVYYDTFTQSTYPYSNGTWPTPPVVATPQPVEGGLLPEDPIAWLRRRVDEVCWKPC